MGDDAFDTFGELPSLYVDDAGDHQQQLLHLPPASAHIAAPSDLSTSPAKPLSTEEIAELLRSIDGDGAEEGEGGESIVLQQELQPQQQSPGGLKQKKKAGKRKKTLSKNPNKARDGRKEELACLRKTVLELETRLSVLQQGSEKSARSIAQSQPTGTFADGFSFTQELSTYYKTGTQPPPAASFSSLLMQKGAKDNAGLHEVWRDIARHQCEERDKSECENIRLRVVLESQLKVAKSLEKVILLKAASTMEISKTVDIRRHHHSSHSNLAEDPSDAEIYHDLLVGVEQSITEVDAVYEANGLADMEKTQMNAQMRFDPENGMFVEVCATKVLPFGIHATGQAVWSHYLFAKQRMPSRYYSYHSHKSIDATDDTIVEDFSLELHAKNTRASFRVRQIMRRVVEEERIVIVWCTFFDPIEFSEQQLSSVRFFEKGIKAERDVAAAVLHHLPAFEYTRRWSGWRKRERGWRDHRLHAELHGGERRSDPSNGRECATGADAKEPRARKRREKLVEYDFEVQYNRNGKATSRWYGKLHLRIQGYSVANNNPKILQVLFKLANHLQYQFDLMLSFKKVMCCSVLFNNAGMLECIWRLPAVRDPWWKWDPNLMRIALERDDPDLQVLDWLHAHLPQKPRVLFERDMIFYTKRGDLEIVRWLHEHKRKISGGAIDIATKMGHVEVLRYFYQHSAKRCEADALHHAAAHGYLDVVKFIVEHKKVISQCAIYWAVTSGHLDVVKYLVESKIRLRVPYVIDSAAIDGHLEIVKYLHDNRVGFLMQTVQNSAKKVIDVAWKYTSESELEEAKTWAVSQDKMEIADLLQACAAVKAKKQKTVS